MIVFRKNGVGLAARNRTFLVEQKGNTRMLEEGILHIPYYIEIIISTNKVHKTSHVLIFTELDFPYPSSSDRWFEIVMRDNSSNSSPKSAESIGSSGKYSSIGQVDLQQQLCPRKHPTTPPLAKTASGSKFQVAFLSILEFLVTAIPLLHHIWVLEEPEAGGFRSERELASVTWIDPCLSKRGWIQYRIILPISSQVVMSSMASTTTDVDKRILLLTGKNYNIWAFLMKARLMKKRLWHVVNTGPTADEKQDECDEFGPTSVKDVRRNSETSTRL